MLTKAHLLNMVELSICKICCSLVKQKLCIIMYYNTYIYMCIMHRYAVCTQSYFSFSLGRALPEPWQKDDARLNQSMCAVLVCWAPELRWVSSRLMFLFFNFFQATVSATFSGHLLWRNDKSYQITPISPQTYKTVTPSFMQHILRRASCMFTAYAAYVWNLLTKLFSPPRVESAH